MVGRDASPSREAVIGALDNCYDPCCRDRRISVVDMGLIESIEIENRKVEIEMVLTTGWALSPSVCWRWSRKKSELCRR